MVWQFVVKSFSKSTDIHAYLAPTSCSSPHLNSNGVSLSKTVGTRLRTIHTNDEELLKDLNLYSGYIIARGYKEQSVKYHLSSMANRSRKDLLSGVNSKKRSLVVPLVTNLHPAVTVMTRFTKDFFAAAINSDPCLSYAIPNSSLLVTYRKLPNLQLLLCKNDQNSLVGYSPPPQSTGYTDTGCSCLVCKASIFSKFARSPSMPGYAVRIPESTHCKSGPAVIYHAICTADRPHCKLAHYVGRAFTSDPSKYAMATRWANHKSHHKKGVNKCELSNHLQAFHKGEDPQTFVKLQILEAAPTFEDVLPLEMKWIRKLFSLRPSGLNIRKEEIEIV